MAIEFVAASKSETATGWTADTVEIHAPAGTAAGDLMVVCFAAAKAANPVLTEPAGWTNFISINSSWEFDCKISYRVFEAGDHSWTWTTTLDTGAGGVILSFSGVKVADPLNVYDGKEENTATPMDIAEITTTVNNCMVIIFGCQNATLPVFSAPTVASLTMTEQIDINDPKSGASGSWVGVVAATGLLATAGATGAGQVAWSPSTTGGGNIALVALNPAPTGLTINGVLASAVDGVAYSAVDGIAV